jgi:hypothetical protein
MPRFFRRQYTNAVRDKQNVKIQNVKIQNVKITQLPKSKPPSGALYMWHLTRVPSSDNLQNIRQFPFIKL